jgi:hypothetical protein
MGRRFVIAMTLFTLLGCSLPEGGEDSAEGVYYAVLSAQLKGDAAAFWRHLVPATRSDLDRWVLLEREGAELLRKHYPKTGPTGRAAAFPLARLTDGRALFVEMATHDGVSLGAMAEVGARVRSETLVGDRILFTTWGSDTLELVRDKDGATYATLPPEHTGLIKSGLQKAEAKLTSLKQAVSKRQALAW